VYRVEGTFVRKNSKYFWFFAHLFVLLASPKVLSLGNEKEKFVFFLHFTRLFVLLHIIYKEKE